MSSPPIPDPYLALGLPKDTTATQVKATYRKLALKFHPDKVTDEALKATAADNFHRVQQAYEILSDDERRAKYDATVKLAELRREVLQRQQQHNLHASPPPPPGLQRSHFVRPEVRTADFNPPSPRMHTTTFSPRHDSARPAAYTDDEYFDVPANRSSSRKHSYVEKDVKKHSARSDSERKIYVREAEKTSRHDRRKVVDKDRRRDRESKWDYVEDNSDSEPLEMPRERERERERDRDRERVRDRDRNREPRNRRKQESSDSEDAPDEYTREIRSRSYNAREYISRSKLKPDDLRKASLRNPAYDNIRPEQEQVRRSSARSPPKDTSYRRDHDRQRQHSEPQVIFQDPFQRPGLHKTRSSPPLERMTSERRSKTLQHPKTNLYDIPTIERSATMPNVSTRRPDGQSRTESRARLPSEAQHVPHISSTSPLVENMPGGKMRRTTSYVVGKNAVSLKTDARPVARSPSPHPPEKRESKSRSNSRRPKLTTSTTLPPLRTHDNDLPPYLGGHFPDAPYTARPAVQSPSPMLSQDGYFGRRRSFGDNEAAEEPVRVLVHDFKPAKMESGRGNRRGSTRPDKHRSPFSQFMSPVFAMR